ncbi:hypothetical protein CALVIDRAFT_543330 [Calocera viscosa TUFC12733]|uniref:Uncharacterized protein n=1 Tax=Calocera viscosa (strain TUFC12733) TaxID=1330018 RepID=A0A167FPZ9_CALVF|nr:hypothetical protein CALVIDRAFT_543330 [Calocera viscosa TUFC12733]
MDSSLAPPAHTSITAQPSSPTSTPHSPLSLHSTPPTTPPSRSPSLPALPDPSPLTLQRRAQSDLASQRIGDRLLKGWAMLGEECPNDTCWGVPLVRKPGRAKGGRGDGGECVICGWGSEADGLGASAAGPSTARAAIRSTGAEDIVHTFHPTPTQPLPTPVTARLAPPPAPAASSARAAHLDSTPLLHGSSISHSVDALNQTLSTLSERLTVLSANPITADPIVIRTLVEAMGAVMDALAKARAMDM